ncbi:MAG: gas vesicle protein G [Saccharothrix sp.]|nr:gas vesicle protein G [Saccharothrix sp.]
MGLLSLLFGLPLAPVRGVVKIAELVRRQVDQELHDPASARRELEELERRRESGELSARDEAEAQERVLGRIVGQPGTEER